MAWVTWRQHRLALAGVVAVFGVAAVYLLITGLQIHHAYAAVTACRPAGSATCQQVAHNFLNANVHGVLVTARPDAADPGADRSVRRRAGTRQGVRDWHLPLRLDPGLRPGRWTVAKLAPLAIAVTVAAGAFSVLFSWYYQPIFGAGGGDSAPALSHHLRPARGCARRLDAGRLRDRRPGRHPDPPGHPRDVRHPCRVGRARLRDRRVPAPALRGGAGHHQPQHSCSARWVLSQGVDPGRQAGQPVHDQPDPPSGRRPGGDARAVPARARDPRPTSTTPCSTSSSTATRN